MKVVRSSSNSEKSRTCALRVSARARLDPPWPRQSNVATMKPRACSSPITSPYFSMNSVLPCSSTQTPRSGAPGLGGKTAVRSRAADGVTMKCGEKTGMLITRHCLGATRRSTARLRQHRAELHGETHVARDAQLALHEGGGRIEFLPRHLQEIVERKRQRGVGRLSRAVAHRVGHRLAVDQHAADGAEVEFQDAAEARILAERGGHLIDDLLYSLRGHETPFPGR